VFHRAGVRDVLRPGRWPAGQVRRRTVVGMLLGGALQHLWPHDRVHYFFARARWELDQFGLAVAQLAVIMVAPDADLRVAVDDSVFRRAGRKVYGAGWQHDGSSPGMNKLSFGNCFVTAEIVISLPFCARIASPYDLDAVRRVVAHSECACRLEGRSACGLAA
jgi:hypothetical protein